MTSIYSHGKFVRRWTRKDKVFLLKNAPTMPIQEIAKQLGRSIASILAQCSRQQVSYFSDKENQDAT